MDKRKSIQDIKISNDNNTDNIKIISDVSNTNKDEKIITPKKKRVLSTKNILTDEIIDDEIYVNHKVKQDSKTESITDNEIINDDQEYNKYIHDENKIKYSSIIISRINRFIKIIKQIKPIYLILFSIIIIALIFGLIRQFKPKNNSVEQNKKEAEMVKKSLSKHIVLPANEQIDIRKITNKVEDPFFKDANIGDYLIIFYKNRIAYIYSIEKDIIINAGVVFIDPKTATTTSTTTTKPTEKETTGKSTTTSKTTTNKR